MNPFVAAIVELALNEIESLGEKGLEIVLQKLHDKNPTAHEKVVKSLNEAAVNSAATNNVTL